jgi:predicted DNA binding CopG/RHH family protein
MNTGRTEVKPKMGRPRNSHTVAQCQMRIPRDLYERMRKRAAFESLPIATWIRECCKTELRRRKKPAL